ncbi:MAG TPA: hypothetical protein VFE36_11780 [Candidatus Baltobacteraceae bacterium]|nr:hypothetical protein [Candidatus Baltobacteraceae bacterium]
MQQPNAAAPLWAQLLPLAIVIVILVVRSIRPARISVTRMWITPIVFCALAALVIYGNQKIEPAPFWEIAGGLIAGIAAGIPFGILRGMHTDVRPTDRPGVMYLGSSWMTIAIYLVAFGLRFVVREAMPHRGALAGVIGDALLGFAIAFIATSYIVIFRKYEVEAAAKA